MRFPSKVTPYARSVLAKFPIVLEALENKDMGCEELYQQVESEFDDAGEFVEVLDCLYALGSIELIFGRLVLFGRKEVLHFVDRNNV